MTDHAKSVRVSPLLDHMPAMEQRDHFSARMIDECIYLDVPVYVRIPIGYVAFTERVRSLVAHLNSGANVVKLSKEKKWYGVSLANLNPDPDLQFLRLARDTLRNIVTSRNATQHLFTLGGLLRSDGAGRGKESSLEHMPFSSACLQPTSEHPVTSDRVTKVPMDDDVANYDYHLKITAADVYIDDSLASMVLTTIKGVNKASCPHENLEEVSPAIYWMYIAARTLNDGRSAGHAEAKTWLKNNAPHGLYKGKQINTAANFVQFELNRFKGRPGKTAKDYKIWEQVERSFRKTYNESFVSPGLARIILATDWWWDLEGNSAITQTRLEAYLDDLGFYKGVEINDLTYFIVGPDSKPQIDGAASDRPDGDRLSPEPVQSMPVSQS